MLFFRKRRRKYIFYIKLLLLQEILKQQLKLKYSQEDKGKELYLINIIFVAKFTFAFFRHT